MTDSGLNEVDNAKDVLRRFVIRARRIEAHSLVKSNDVLKYVQPRFQIKYTESNAFKIKYLMPGEEIFESLAARVRPCILKTEPVYLDKVFQAIEICMGSRQMEVNEQQCLDDCRHRFNDLCNKHSGMSYSVQKFDAGNSALEDSLTDLQLGEAWLYADLVHSDPHGYKAKATEFPYRDRYYAGTSFFSSLTVVVIDTYKLVTALNKQFQWNVDESAWREQVTIAEKDSEFAVDGMWVLPVGTEVPEGTSPADMSGAVNISSLTEARRVLTPQFWAVAIYYNNDVPIEQFPATYFLDDNQLSILIADSLVYTISIEQWPPVPNKTGHTGSITFRPYNNARLISEKILQAMHQSNHLVLILNVPQAGGIAHINVPLNQH